MDALSQTTLMQLCAMQVAKILGKERTACYLKESFYSLLKDPALIVQSKLFAILPTVIGLILAFLVQLLKFETAICLHGQIFCGILNINWILRNFVCWIPPGYFSVSNAQTKAANYAAMIPALVQADKSVSGTNQWRMQRSLLRVFPLLPVCPPLSLV